MKARQLTFEEKIQKVIDVEDIRTLMANYCHGMDKKDEATFMSIWAEDGVCNLPRGNGSGTEEINKLLHEVWAQVPVCHHHITNPVIEIDGNRASGKADVIYFRKTDDGVWQLLSGTYTYEFVKGSGEWLIRALKFARSETVSPIFQENSKG